MARSSPPFAARSLAIALILAGIWLGCATGGAIGIGLVVVPHDGWAAMGHLPISSWGMPEKPPWLSEDEKFRASIFISIFCLVLAMAGTGLGLKLWRFLVVQKLRWMTNEEADEVFKHYPEF
jgi:hypothetical protein